MTDKPEGTDAPDRSNGWETIARDFISDCRESTVGVASVERWAAGLPRHARVLDLGCGPGTPRSEVLSGRDFSVYGVDASPSMTAAYRQRFPDARVACEPAEESSFFGLKFDGVLAWGLLFLLQPVRQQALIHRVASALKPGGTFLFTAPSQVCTWADLSTGRKSISLGADVYRTTLADAGLVLVAEHDDEGDNHYYEAVRP